MFSEINEFTSIADKIKIFAERCLFKTPLKCPILESTLDYWITDCHVRKQQDHIKGNFEQAEWNRKIVAILGPARNI